MFREACHSVLNKFAYGVESHTEAESFVYEKPDPTHIVAELEETLVDGIQAQKSHEEIMSILMNDLNALDQ